MTFQKRVEDFTCEHCGHENKGSGFTDHCQMCLWSKHVDVDPGDRAHPCGGLMEPVDVEVKGKEYRVKNHCLKCGFERYAQVLPIDNFEAALVIVRKKASLS